MHVLHICQYVILTFLCLSHMYEYVQQSVITLKLKYFRIVTDLVTKVYKHLISYQKHKNHELMASACYIVKNYLKN